MAKSTIVVSCMDRRLNKLLDSMNDGRQIFVRNAGGNVAGLEQTIRFLIENNNIGEIQLIEHTDCGAMGYVYSALKEGKDGLHRQLVEEFKDAKFSTRLELEQKNEKLQKDIAEKLFAGNALAISSKLVELNEKADNGQEHTLVITKAVSDKYSEMAENLGLAFDNCYFLQANSIYEVLPDIGIATDLLGIKRIVLLATNASQYRQTQLDLQALKTRGIEGKARLEVARL